MWYKVQERIEGFDSPRWLIVFIQGGVQEVVAIARSEISADNIVNGMNAQSTQTSSTEV